ncbi:hypothetical protein CBR_g22081 [Chara braunii]|uniref:Uncharacterized protein n=1 Tax=Chara braunii TaxID=69332 RepID=A0A388L1Y6_CHABU|nr:hypothetical protein CBR_g22081 [Chara braunii]|eukprot:GBG76334.1 hypothetical protein CBR_g22081 [Chara braunii]
MYSVGALMTAAVDPPALFKNQLLECSAYDYSHASTSATLPHQQQEFPYQSCSQLARLVVLLVPRRQST